MVLTPPRGHRRLRSCRWVVVVLLSLLRLSATTVSSFRSSTPQNRRKSSTFSESTRRRKICSPKRKTDAVSLTTLNLVAWSSDVHNHYNLLEAYSTLLQNHPVPTKVMTAALLATMGDAIAQFQSQPNTNSNSSSSSSSPTVPYDVKRGAAFLVFGALYTGLFQHYWFAYLSAHIREWGSAVGIWGVDPPATRPTAEALWQYSRGGGGNTADEWWSYFDLVARFQNPPTDVAVAVAKVAVNQFFVVPAIYMPLFFAVTGALGGLNVNQAQARARSLYLPLLQRNYFYWLPMQFVQFFVVPPEWQIPFVSLASLAWTIVLSSIGGSSTLQSAAPSQIVAYETISGSETDAQGDKLIQVVLVDAGAVNAVTDEVRIADVSAAFVPEEVSDAVQNVLADVQAGASGVALGLLASAADEGAIGTAVGNLVNAEVGVGVALVAAVSAGVGMLAAASLSDDDDDTKNSSDALPTSNTTAAVLPGQSDADWAVGSAGAGATTATDLVWDSNDTRSTATTLSDEGTDADGAELNSAETFYVNDFVDHDNGDATVLQPSVVLEVTD